MTLLEFLLARISEDQLLAREADDHCTAEDWARVADTNQDEAVAAHLRQWSPRRVMEECAAKHVILRMGSGAAEAGDIAYMTDEQRGQASAYEDVLRLLALPYDNHPDYQSVWRA